METSRGKRERRESSSTVVPGNISMAHLEELLCIGFDGKTVLVNSLGWSNVF